MKWSIFTGTWRLTNQEVRDDVYSAVRDVLRSGNGIITGGATGVDYFCMEEVMRLGKLSQLRVFLPTKLDYYIEHYHTAYEKGKIDKRACDELGSILIDIQKQSPASILEMGHAVLTQHEYNERNSEEIKYGDEVYAFQVNNSTGTEDTLNKAREKGIPIMVHKQYTIQE